MRNIFTIDKCKLYNYKIHFYIKSFYNVAYRSLQFTQMGACMRMESENISTTIIDVF